MSNNKGKARHTDDFNHVRVAFMQRAAAPEMPALALKLAYLIAFKHINVKSRSTFVGQDTLADELNTTARSVKRMVAVLRPLGLEVEPGHGPNRANTYRIAEVDKGTPVSPVDAENRTPVSPIEGEKGTSEAQKGDSKGDTSVPPTKGTKFLTKERVSDSLCRRSFDRFWQVYPKHVAKLTAEKAFAKAVKTASADAIIAGAERYAAEREGQAPQWTANPTTWLNDERWTDEPPANGRTVTLDQNGNVIAHASPNNNMSAKEEHREKERAARAALKAAADEIRRGND